MAFAGPTSAPPPMPSSLSNQLDSTPPSPQLNGGGPGGEATPMSLNGLMPPDPMSSGQMPPEILSGVVASSQTMDAVLSSWAQVVPDLGADIAMIKTLIATVLAKLVQRGALPASPTAVGPAPPMGGTDRGIASGGFI